MADINQMENDWEDSLIGLDDKTVGALRVFKKNVDDQWTALAGLIASSAPNTQPEEVSAQTKEDSGTIIDTAVEITLRRILAFIGPQAASMISNAITNYFAAPVNITNIASGDIMIYDSEAGEWIGATTEEQTVVIDVQYDSTTKQLQKATRTITCINPGEASGWGMITGGQAVEET